MATRDPGGGALHRHFQITSPNEKLVVHMLCGASAARSCRSRDAPIARASSEHSLTSSQSSSSFVVRWCGGACGLAPSGRSSLHRSARVSAATSQTEQRSTITHSLWSAGRAQV
eukprot:2350900-Prymnesium_polylepis.1